MPRRKAMSAYARVERRATPGPAPSETDMNPSLTVNSRDQGTADQVVSRNCSVVLAFRTQADSRRAQTPKTRAPRHNTSQRTGLRARRVTPHHREHRRERVTGATLVDFIMHGEDCGDPAQVARKFTAGDPGLTADA